MTAYDYIKDDLAEYPFNAKYPPYYEQNGGLYHGYKNNSEGNHTHGLLKQYGKKQERARVMPGQHCLY